MCPIAQTLWSISLRKKVGCAWWDYISVGATFRCSHFSRATIMMTKSWMLEVQATMSTGTYRNWSKTTRDFEACPKSCFHPHEPHATRSSAVSTSSMLTSGSTATRNPSSVPWTSAAWVSTNEATCSSTSTRSTPSSLRVPDSPPLKMADNSDSQPSVRRMQVNEMERCRES